MDTWKWLGLIVIALLMGANSEANTQKRPAQGPGSPVSGDALLGIHDRARRAQLHLEAGRFEQADRDYSQVVDDPRFGDLSKSSRAHYLRGAGGAALAAGQTERARALLLRAERIEPDHAGSAWLLMWVAMSGDDVDEAATALTRVASGWPQLLEHMPDRSIGAILGRLPKDSPTRRPLLQALFEADWTNHGRGADAFWHMLALAYISDGKPDAARPVVRRIQAAETLVDIRIDRRFDALADRDSPSMDVALAARNHRDRLLARLESEPANLTFHKELGDVLLTLGEHEAVLEVAERAGAIMAAHAVEGAPLQGAEDANWIFQNRSDALVRLGRFEEALAELDRLRQSSEDGEPNVSQTLNHAAMLVNLGRPTEAIEAVDGVRGMSVYGQLVQASVRYGAALQLADEALAARSLEFIQTHRGEGPRILLFNLLRGGDLDGAAALLIELLGSEADRTEALAFAQDYLRGPELPHAGPIRANRDVLLARPDVRAAIDEVGRIESHPIFRLRFP